MFSAFDLKFFQMKLKCVELEWSKRMYQCAGICYQRRNGYGMSCTIRLSEPLLKLRPRKDLVQTLLHEMIHAYLFILNIREGNGGHGPNFKKIMEGINKIAGTNITVYHTFHDEVELYKTHWWRCNGICQHRKPFCKSNSVLGFFVFFLNFFLVFKMDMSDEPPTEHPEQVIDGGVDT